MQHVYDEVGCLDKRCYESFNLSEDLLMEHAALGMASFIRNNFETSKTILVVCGVGNNGADGIALSRLLYLEYDIKLYIPFVLKSQMSKIQYSRVVALNIPIISYLCSCDIVVDCLYGSGLNRILDKEHTEIIHKLNRLEAYKIACDIPSGINQEGQILTEAFIADATLTMGALKKSLFTDNAKDFIGDLEVCNLGLSRELYERDSDIFYLEKEDMELPFRNSKNSHKGKFGHSVIIVGEKEGAGLICADASFSFGSGLVSILSHNNLQIPNHIMKTHCLPKNMTSLAIGMGLGNYEKSEVKKFLKRDVKKVIDADLFYEELILDILYDEVVLTPHPKEFVSLLNLTKVATISINELQNNRFKYLKLFCAKYSNVTVVLKGANTLIGKNEKIYINSHGTQALSKGGSGDVLSGLIASLLSQGYECLDAAITASLAHSFAASEFTKNSYSLKPQDIIQGVTIL